MFGRDDVVDYFAHIEGFIPLGECCKSSSVELDVVAMYFFFWSFVNTVNPVFIMEISRVQLWSSLTCRFVADHF